jgi:hypothetical protein
MRARNAHFEQLSQSIEDSRDEEEQVEDQTGKSQDKTDGTEINIKRVESTDAGAAGPSESSAAER